MKYFQTARTLLLLTAITAISTLINCGGNGNNNAAPPVVTSLSVNADGTCTPRLEKDLLRYLESCKSFNEKNNEERRKKLAQDCNRFTRTHGEGVECNLTNLPGGLDDPRVRSCLALDDDQTASNGILAFRVKGIHRLCGGFADTVDLVNPGVSNTGLILPAPPGFSEDGRYHRSENIEQNP